MHVLATAGHVDHGKSTLVHALTGQDPDRLSEEHRRGLSIELGFCWTDSLDCGEVAFVDVPGHERFISTMLAGVGPVPAVLLVVGADDPWMPQAAEHLTVLDALGVRHGVVAVTRSDLAAPAHMVAEAAARLRGTTLEGSAIVPVSGHSGEGLDVLRAAVAELVARLPEPDLESDVRLWVDRRFTRPGAGTIVTGTLSAGRLRVGDSLEHGDAVLRIRAIQSLGRPRDEMAAVARVALRLGGDVPTSLERGTPLVTPRAWLTTSVADVRVPAQRSPQLPERPILHIGAASVGVRVRPLGDDVVRLQLDRALPLRVGDTALLRDPGSRRVWGVTVLDPMPPALGRRGAARRRAAELANSSGVPDVADELRRRRVVRRDDLRRIGVAVEAAAAPQVAVAADGWLLDATRVHELERQLHLLVAEQLEANPIERGLAAGAASRALELPTDALLRLLVRPPVRLADGLVTLEAEGSDHQLPLAVEVAVATLEQELGQHPFAAPTADRLVELGLRGRALGAAVRAGRLIRVGETVMLLPGADVRAAAILASLRQPFTLSEARVALDTSRRVMVPLLELMDSRGLTRRGPDDRREVAGAVDPPGGA